MPPWGPPCRGRPLPPSCRMPARPRVRTAGHISVVSPLTPPRHTRCEDVARGPATDHGGQFVLSGLDLQAAKCRIRASTECELAMFSPIVNFRSEQLRVIPAPEVPARSDPAANPAAIGCRAPEAAAQECRTALATLAESGHLKNAQRARCACSCPTSWHSTRHYTTDRWVQADAAGLDSPASSSAWISTKNGNAISSNSGAPSIFTTS